MSISPIQPGDEGGGGGGYGGGGSIPVSITTSSLPIGNVGSNYFQSLNAVNGYPPYSWSLSSGSLPTGLILSSSGIISGTPTLVGDYTFTIGVSDSISGTSSRTLTIQINPSSNPVITTTSLLPVNVNESYSQTLVAINGTPPYVSWEVLLGSLPTGITLDEATGAISGTPTVPGNYSFTIEVTDSNGLKDIQALSIFVKAISPTIVTVNLSEGVTGNSYTSIISATGGTPPYTNWEISSGQLPPGLNITGYPTTATITGIPTTVGNYNFTVKVTDTLSGNNIHPFNIIIYDGRYPIISTIDLSDGELGNSYSQTLVAAGGSLPYKWSLDSDVLPPGLILNQDTGVIHGVAVANGSYVFTIRVIDANNNADTQILSITIGSYTLPAITTNQIPNTLISLPYYTYIQAVGGDLPYTWSTTSTLPAGLTLNPISGLLSGVTTDAGEYSFDIIVEDILGKTDTHPFTISIGDSTLPIIITTNISSADRLITYNQKIVSLGGTPSYVYTLSSGSLPTGLTLSSSGIISGIATDIGLYNFTITVTDFSNNTDTQDYSLIVKSTGYDSRCCTCVFTNDIVEFSHNAPNGTLTSTGGTILSNNKWQAPSTEGYYNVIISIEGVNGIISVKNTIHVIKRLEVVGNDFINHLLPGDPFTIETNYPSNMVTWKILTSDINSNSLVMNNNGNLLINTDPADKCFGAIDCTVRGTLGTIENCIIESYVDVRIVVNPIYPTPDNCGPSINKWLREAKDFRVIITEFEGGCDETHIRNKVPIVRWTVTYDGLINYLDSEQCCPNCKGTIDCRCNTSNSTSAIDRNNNTRECLSILQSSNRLDDFWNLVYAQYKLFTLIDYDTGEIWYNVRFEDNMSIDHRHRRTATSRTVKLVWKPCCNKTPAGGTCSKHGIINYKDSYMDVPYIDPYFPYQIVKDGSQDVVDDDNIVID